MGHDAREVPWEPTFRNRMDVLDHGYVEVIESWGSDERVIESARMSTQKGFEGWGTPEAPGDEKLLRYLWKNEHSTPFEMAGATFEVQAPIFVFREWHRHRTQSFSEASARYAPLPDVNYVPTIERLMMGGKSVNKQAGAMGREISQPLAETWQRELVEAYGRAQTDYATGLANGVPKELARLVLPVGRYSKMRASANLRNWLGFLKLRMAPAAQYEIRTYANAVHAHLSELYPRTLALFDEGLPK